MPPAPPPAAPQPAPQPAAAPLGPPEEEFWEKYSAHAEFPISTVATVFIHVAIGAVLIVLLTTLMNRNDKSSVPIKLVEITGGPDEAGDGSAGSGGIADPIAQANDDPFKATKDAMPNPKMLPLVMDEIKKEIKLEDPNANVPIAAQNAAAWAMTDKKLRDKLLGLGAKKGEGGGPGSGDSGQPGAGPGGTGADSTRARTMRWVLRFRTNSGQDYLDQLAVMGAAVIVPVPPDEEKCLIFTDLKNPGPGKTATEGDIANMSRQIKFSDTRKPSVEGVSQALSLMFTPRSFWAFFPKTLEEELARKETAYRNRRSEDIEETVFQVTVRGGGYDLLVYEQTAKR